MKPAILVILSACICICGISQSITGNWQGLLPVNGTNLRLIFHVTNSTGAYSTSFDSPDQHAFGLPCTNTTVKDDSLLLGIAVIHGGYRGKWNGRDEITGIYFQGTANMALSLQRISDKETPKVEVKPQTPKPPFDYISENVEYENTVQQVHLGASFTKPRGDKKLPVVIMITGSGMQDRDETIGAHKPFFVIADYLAKQGIAVLRVDDRGAGKSTGDYASSSSEDFATDVMAGINYLKTRTDIDPTKIGLIGHSEGGLIAPYVAARTKDIAFIVTLAGPAVGGQNINDFQNTLPLQRAGMSKENIDAFLVLHHRLVNAAISITDDAAYKQSVQQIFMQWKAAQTPATLHALIPGADPDQAIISKTEENYRPFGNKWWKFIFTYNPITDIQKLNIPVLALNGEKDEQVEASSNLAAFSAALQKSGSKQYKTIQVPGVNHLFQHCKNCGSIREYLELEETFDPATLQIIAQWIKEVTKS